MTSTPPLSALRRRLVGLLCLTHAVRALVMWAVLWGVVALAVRTTVYPDAPLAAWGVLGLLPVAAWTLWRARRQLPGEETLRALLDAHNRLDGESIGDAYEPSYTFSSDGQIGYVFVDTADVPSGVYFAKVDGGILDLTGILSVYR